ncbi:MAG: PD-(D/E)XK nuclease family protein, partial [Hominimerdicola sp.]
MVTIIEGGINSNHEDIFTQRIKKAVEENKNVLVLIPDQFSFEYDKKLYKILGAVNFNRIRTAGFNRLAELMAVQYGESGKENASENAKIIMMYKAVKRLRETGDVRFYGKSLDKGGFIADIISLIGQFRESGITPEALRISAEKVHGSVSLKLFDIARLYKFYMEELENAKLKDSISSVAQSVRLARKHEFFSGVSVFVTSFNNFTYDEKNMLKVCINQAESFTISLIADKECINSFNNHPFSETIRTEQEIKNIASENNKPIEFIFADKSLFNSPEIEYIGKNIFNLGKHKYSGKCDSVKVVSSTDMYEETEYICAQIMRLVREENYKFKDIAVTVRDLKACSAVFEGIFERYEIPYFIDLKNKVTASSLVQYLNSLFKCVLTRKYKTENILKFIKSPLFAMLN